MFLRLGADERISQESSRANGPGVAHESIGHDVGRAWAKASPEHPNVAGVIMDIPIKTETASIVSVSSGDASIYTTGTFGVVGGYAHEAVRKAAVEFVTVCEKHFDEATLTKDYPYPAAGRVRFYLICHDGVRVIDADLESLTTGKHKASDLFAAGNRVGAEFRKVTQKHENGILR